MNNIENNFLTSSIINNIIANIFMFTIPIITTIYVLTIFYMNIRSEEKFKLLYINFFKLIIIIHSIFCILNVCASYSKFYKSYQYEYYEILIARIFANDLWINFSILPNYSLLILTYSNLVLWMFGFLWIRKVNFKTNLYKFFFGFLGLVSIFSYFAILAENFITFYVFFLFIISAFFYLFYSLSDYINLKNWVYFFLFYASSFTFFIICVFNIINLFNPYVSDLYLFEVNINIFSYGIDSNMLNAKFVLTTYIGVFLYSFEKATKRKKFLIK